MSPAVIHPTAIIEDKVEIGDLTTVWDHVHIRGPSRLGSECIVGEKTYIAYGVEVGDRVKINAHVYICTGVSIEDGVMVSAGVVFTNDRYPRATTPDLARLRSSEPGEGTESTRVSRGATIGAGAVIGSDLEIGQFAVVGMGAVVTRSVPDFHLALGSPAKTAGYVCRCGRPFLKFPVERALTKGEHECDTCGFAYRVLGGKVRESPR